MRLRIDLAYDGTKFYGWAKQPMLRTVQGELERSLRKVLHLSSDNNSLMHDCPRLTVAGRTDAGVHASHQVCHFDIAPELLDQCVGHMKVQGCQALLGRLNCVTSDDIAIHSVRSVPNDFDARFSALERTYVYRICDDDCQADPRLRSSILRINGSLDVDAMNSAAAMAVGLHDFGSFAVPNPGGTTIRQVKFAHWHRVSRLALFDQHSYEIDSCDSMVSDDQLNFYQVPHVESGLLVFVIVADAFAHSMVRSLVHAFVKIGQHKRTLDWFAAKMAHPAREGDTGPIAACGLTLEHVAYPPDHLLAERAARIRAKRTLPSPHC